MEENKDDINENLIEEKNDSIKLDIKDVPKKDNNLINLDKIALVKMGYEKDLVDRIYKNAFPVNIDEALDYLYKNSYNQFTHLYISTPLKICAICEEEESYHSKEIFYSKEKNDQLIKLSSTHLNYNNNESELICDICESEITYNDIKKCKILCKHLFCFDCWFEFFKEKINNGKVYNLKCMKHECSQILDEKFVRSIIDSDKELLKKYEKFLETKKILISNKKVKFCPFPDCDSYAEKTSSKKYVKCKNGHEFCFICGQKPHGWKSCSKIIDKGFEEWKTHTLVKRCPYCKYWTEKQDGCNHMTCAECNFQWCWICEKECVVGHFAFGTCKGLQFSDVYSKEDVKQLLCDNCGFFCCFSWIIMKIIFLIIYLTMMPLFYLVVLMKDVDEETENINTASMIFYYMSFLPFFICYEVITICYVAVISIPAIIIWPHYRFMRYIFYGKIFGKLFSV